MIKAHILSCPICDHILSVQSPPQDIGGSGFEKTCNSKYPTLILRFNCCLELEKIILMAPKDIKNLQFQWDAGSAITVSNWKTGTKFKLPWFEPDLYLYEELIKKLKTYIIFS